MVVSCQLKYWPIPNCFNLTRENIGFRPINACVQNKKKEGKKKHGSHSLDLSTHRRHSQFLGLIYCILAPPLNCTSSCVFKLQKYRAQYAVPSYFYFPCAYFPFLSSLSFSISYKFEVNFSFF